MADARDILILNGQAIPRSLLIRIAEAICRAEQMRAAKEKRRLRRRFYA